MDTQDTTRCILSQFVDGAPQSRQVEGAPMKANH